MLNNGKIVFGTCINSFCPSLIELAGFCGLDFCRIDNEHAWRQDESLDNMIRGAIIGNIFPIVRIDKGNEHLIRKVFEIGAGGVIVPGIKNSQEVRDVVKASKFPPKGTRGYGGNCLSAGYGTQAGEEWINWSNGELMVGIMIEEEEAVKDIENIMAIEGLDFVLFGPSDYSLSIGLPAPSKNHLEVQIAIEKTAKAAKKYHKFAMVTAKYPWEKEIERYVEMGYQMIQLGNEYYHLKKSWGEALSIGKKFVKPDTLMDL